MTTRGSLLGIIFDFGGVIWNMRWDVCRELEDSHALPRGAIFETLYRTQAWQAIERGRGDPGAWREEAHHLLEARAGRALPGLHDAWRAAQHLIAENVALVRALRPPYRIALLSNADSSLPDRLQNGGIHGLFDTVVCSAAVGMAKPERAIYHLTAERLGLAPETCVFVDDHAPNVAAAEEVGMRGVLFRVDRGHDLRGQLSQVGVTPRQ